MVTAEGDAHAVADLDLVALVDHGLLDDRSEGPNHTADSG